MITSPAVHEGVVYAGSSDGRFFQALDARTGVEKWRRKLEDRVFSLPAIVGGFVIFGDGGSYLQGLDIETGEPKLGTFSESGVFSSPWIADGMIYFGSDDNHLYALE